MTADGYEGGEKADSIVLATTEPMSQPMRHVDSQHIDKDGFLEEVLKSRRELHVARQQFDQVSDPLLIDHVVFRIGAAERHLNYLFRLARDLDISYDGAQWAWTSDTWRID